MKSIFFLTMSAMMMAASSDVNLKIFTDSLELSSDPVTKQSLKSAKPAVSKYKLHSPATVAAFTARDLFSSKEVKRAIIGFSKNSKPIEAWYFPGRTSQRALVVGGMHGSELSSIEVAKQLIVDLKKSEQPHYSVIIIPCLFPDNAVQAISNPGLIGSNKNVGRYSHEHAVDPNRQMPSAGKAFNVDDKLDHLGRTIEVENTMLLSLIQEYQPQRLISVHAIRDSKNAGIFADPKTDSRGFALGFEEDSVLVISMAKHIEVKGGDVAGNRLSSTPTAKYYCDPAIVAKGEWQARNLKGSTLPADRGKGTSMGTWVSTAVEEGVNRRAAITTLTMEFPGYKRTEDYLKKEERTGCKKNISLYAESIRKVFLENL